MSAPANQPRRVQKIGSIVSQLMSRRGYGQITASDEISDTVAAAVGKELAAAISVGNLRGGVLQVYATDSVTLQELNFQKREILRRIQQSHPQSSVTDLRFRIQS